MGAFLEDSVPVAEQNMPGRYRSSLGENWDAFNAFGGATMGAAIRAARAFVADGELDLVAAHAVYLAPTATGELTLDVEALRAGRSIQQISTVLRNQAEDPPTLALHSTWGRREPDPIRGVAIAAPAVPEPDDPAVSPLVHDPRFAHLGIHRNFEERACPGLTKPGALLEGHVAESAVWARLVDGHRDDHGDFDPSVLAVVADRVPGPHLGTTISPPDPDLPARPMVTLELAIRFITDPSSEWLLLQGTVVEAANRYITTRATIWDLDRTLIAIADQTARFSATPVNPPSSPVDST